MSPDRASLSVVAMFALNGALFGIWASRIPAVAEAMALGPAQLGLLLLCIAGGAIASFPLAGALSDRLGAARVSRGLALVNLAGLALAALAPGPLTLAAALVLFGAGHGGMDVAMNGWGAEVERARGRPSMSFFHATWSMGAGLGALSGAGAVALGAGVAPHFLVAGGAAAALALWLARPPWESRSGGAGGPAFALPRGALLLVGVVAFGSSLGEGAMADWSALFLVEVAGASEARAALGYAVYSVAMVAMRLAGGRVTARLGPVPAARASQLVSASGAALAVLVGTVWAALAGFALMGLGYALIVPLAFSRAANDPGTSQGRAIASVATLGYGGMLLGPVAIGLLASGIGLRGAFGVLALLALATVVPAGRLAPAGGAARA